MRRWKAEKGGGLLVNAVKVGTCFWAGWYATCITYGMWSGRGDLRRRRAAKGNDLRENAAEFGICFRHG